MRMKFSKMHGLGNDFVVIENLSRNITLKPEQVRHLADRRTGIGCDQLLLVEPARNRGADFAMRIFNANGTEAEQCGNGVRCVTLFVHEQGLISTPEMSIETAGGPVISRLASREQIAVEMGIPCLEPAGIPLLANRRALSYDLNVGGTVATIGAVSMGNPHAVMRVDDVDTAPVSTLGPAIQEHSCFPDGANVGFMQIIDTRRIRLRVFERGAGETPACGTGACAAVVVGREQGLLEHTVEVNLPGGRLHVAWSGGTCPVRMTGPAVRVFTGEIEI
ncbi:MAG: diaminopimelate epimerase [Gammaproteobacteria bacterium]